MVGEEEEGGEREREGLAKGPCLAGLEGRDRFGGGRLWGCSVWRVGDLYQGEIRLFECKGGSG